MLVYLIGSKELLISDGPFSKSQKKKKKKKKNWAGGGVYRNGT